jgi:UDP-N-acetyl-D-mannosaminuronic acid transferase (WecB/TagA/CpsF family)
MGLRNGLLFIFLLTMVAYLSAPISAPAKEAIQEWELVNPEGTVVVKPIKMNPHPKSLEGKTVALRWNGKQNGNHFLERVAELLKEKVKNIKILKIYELEPWTNITAGPPYMTPEEGKKVAQKIAGYKPDIVLASQAD